MWKTFKNKCTRLIKSVFIGEPVETSSFKKEDSEKLLLERKLDRILKEDDLVDLMKDEVVGAYLLVTYTSSIQELVEPVSKSLNNTLDPVAVSVYFYGNESNIYHYLKQLRRILQGKVSVRHLNDINEIIEMFYFYKGDDNGN